MTIQTIDTGVTLYVFRTTVNANFAELSTLMAGKYTKPSTGIPATDLDAATQTLLGKANTALQAAPVASVAGRTGAVTLTVNDIGGAVKTVNNVAPDVNGNVTISVSAGSVASTGITDSTAAGRALLTAADVAAQRTALGLGTAALQAATAFATAAQGTKADNALPAASVGVANGAASLDGTGKVPTSQLPASVLGALNYQGAWNASTNVPALASGAGTKGFYYTVSTAGTTSLDGLASWDVGDHVVFNGTTWERFEGTVPVKSINGKSLAGTGDAGITAADVGAATAAQGAKADAAQPKTTVSAGTALGATKATTDADDGGTFTAAVNSAVTVHSGAVAGFGFGVSGAGIVTFTGASGVTVTDKRTSGAANPVCALVQLGANAYEVWGTKA